jgi:hypothetical protein
MVDQVRQTLPAANAVEQLGLEVTAANVPAHDRDGLGVVGVGGDAVEV